MNFFKKFKLMSSNFQSKVENIRTNITEATDVFKTVVSEIKTNITHREEESFNNSNIKSPKSSS